MVIKDKINQLKTLLIGSAIASMTLSSCDNGNKGEEFHQTKDMLTTDNVRGADMYGNPMTLKKIKVAVYKDKYLTEQRGEQLVWGLDNNHQADSVRTNKKTHGEVYVAPNGEVLGYVEVYSDGVLKDNNSLRLVDKKIQVVGQGDQYQSNLDRHMHEMEDAKIQQKRLEIEKNKAKERAEMRRKAMEAEEQKKDIVEVKTDTIKNKEVSVKEKYHTVAHPKDTAIIDTLHHLKNQSER